MLYEKERKQIIDACLKLQDMNFFIGTYGNVSIRVGEHIILTPSKVDYNTMQPEDLVVIDLAGNIVEGHRKPTSEMHVHRLVLAQSDMLGACVHAHSKYAMSVATLDIPAVPCLVEEMAQVIGGDLPLTRTYVDAGQHLPLGEEAAASIGERWAVLLRNHGPVACGRDIDEAVLCARVVEKACELFLAAKATGLPMCPMPAEKVLSECDRYRYHYGQDKK